MAYNESYVFVQALYSRNSNNPINANNYLSCLFHKEKHEVDKEIIEEVINKLESNPSERSQEMYCSAKAKALANFDGNINSAYKIIEESISKYPNVTYPVLTLADLAIQYKNIDKLNYAITLLDKSESKNTQTYRTYIRYKAILFAMTGRYKEAVTLVKNELRGVRREALEKFYNKLQLFDSVH